MSFDPTVSVHKAVVFGLMLSMLGIGLAGGAASKDAFVLAIGLLLSVGGVAITYLGAVDE